jgi:hypothetical protein
LSHPASFAFEEDAMPISRIAATLFVGCLALGAVSPAHAMFNSYLKLEGPAGEAEDLPRPPQNFATTPTRPSASIVRNFTITRKLVVQQGPAKLRAK